MKDRRRYRRQRRRRGPDYYGAIAALILRFGVKRPTEQQMEAAVRAAPEKAEAPRPAIA
jgi:hypothetical protein